jgi:ribosomal protein L7/L12
MKLFGYEITIKKIQSYKTPIEKAKEVIIKYYNENKNYFNCGSDIEISNRKIELIKMARSNLGIDKNGICLLGLKELKELVESMFDSKIKFLE